LLLILRLLHNNLHRLAHTTYYKLLLLI
jgi:hypothetical protein